MLNSSTSPVTVNPSQGFVSLTDNGGGVFVLTLGAANGGVPTYDPYVRLLNVSSCGVGDLGLVYVTTDNVNGASGNPSLTLQVIAGSLGPGPGPLPDGSTLFVEVTLSNTTAY